METIKWDGDTTQDIMELMESMNELFKAGLFDQIDYIVATMPLKTATSTMLVSMLRFTSAAKESLPSWYPMVITTYHEVQSRGENADDIMMGLIQ